MARNVYTMPKHGTERKERHTLKTKHDITRKWSDHESTERHGIKPFQNETQHDIENINQGFLLH